MHAALHPEPARTFRARAEFVYMRGVTLIELLVVLVILSVLMAVIPPLFHSQLGAARAERTLAELTSGLRYARSQAIARNEPVGVHFDLAERTYELTGDSGTRRRLPEDLRVRVITGRSEITGRSSGAIRFYPDGTSSGGEIHLLGDRRDLVVKVAWLTGKVHIHGPAASGK